jgi:hypothetical protein
MTTPTSIIPVEFISVRRSSLLFLNSFLSSISDQKNSQNSQSVLEQAVETLLDKNVDIVPPVDGKEFKAIELPRHLRRRTTSHLRASEKKKHPERGQGGQRRQQKKEKEKEVTKSTSTTLNSKKRKRTNQSEEHIDDNDDSKLVLDIRSRRRKPALLKDFWRRESISALKALIDPTEFLDKHSPIITSSSSSSSSSSSLLIIPKSDSSFTFRTLTHMWQAKRMQMQRIELTTISTNKDTSDTLHQRKIECILPMSRLDTSTSAALEWSRSTNPATCVAFDTSHMITITINGSRNHICTLLQSVLDPSEFEKNDESDNNSERNEEEEEEEEEATNLSSDTTRSKNVQEDVNILKKPISRSKKATLRRAAAKKRWKLSQKDTKTTTNGILNKAFVCGALAAVDIMLYTPNTFPQGAIAPVTMIWLPAEGGSSGQATRTLLLLVHISAVSLAISALKSAANVSLLKGSIDISVSGKDNDNISPPCVISLRGPGTRAAIASLNCCFVKNAGIASSKYGNKAKSVIYGVTAFTSSSSLSYIPDTLKVATSVAHVAKRILLDEFVTLVEDDHLASHTLNREKEEKTFDNEDTDGFLALESYKPQSQVDETNTSKFIEPIEPILLLGAPIIFIKRACSDADTQTIDAIDSCILIVPPSAAQDVWLQLVTRGQARAIGNTEWSAISCERGSSHFPRDYPETYTGRSWWERKLEKDTLADALKPLLKRSFAKKQQSITFAPNWNLLWPKLSQQPLVVRQSHYKLTFFSPGARAVHPTLIPFRLVFPGRSLVLTDSVADFAEIYMITSEDRLLWNESLISSSDHQSSIVSASAVSAAATKTTTQDRLHSLVSNKKVWLGVEEGRIERLDGEIEDKEEGKRASSRTLIGFITSLCLSPSISRVVGTAFVEAESCRKISIEQEIQVGKSLELQVLVRSSTSNFYHPAILF